MSERLQQLRLFVAMENLRAPGYTHIAQWALLEIERLSDLTAQLQSALEADRQMLQARMQGKDMEIGKIAKLLASMTNSNWNRMRDQCLDIVLPTTEVGD